MRSYHTLRDLFHAIATLTQPYLKQRYVAVTLEQACALHGQAVARISAAFGAPA